jgi:hypothetical protein
MMMIVIIKTILYDLKHGLLYKALTCILIYQEEVVMPPLLCAQNAINLFLIYIFEN